MNQKEDINTDYCIIGIIKVVLGTICELLSQVRSIEAVGKFEFCNFDFLNIPEGN